jgi:hypothetical protein
MDDGTSPRPAGYDSGESGRRFVTLHYLLGMRFRSLSLQLPMVGALITLAVVSSAAQASVESFTPAVQATVVGATEGGQIYVTGGSNMVYRYGSDFALLGSFGGFGTEAGKLGAPVAIEERSDGSIFVADLDYNNFPAQEFSASGTPVRTFGICCNGQAQDVALVGADVDILRTGGTVERYQADGTLIGSFSAYTGAEGAHMAVSPSNGNLYVVGRISQQIREYTPVGSLVTSWNAGLGDGVATNGIAIDPAGGVYVAGRTMIRKFDSEGEALATHDTGGYLSDIAIKNGKLYLAQSQTVARVDIGVPIVSVSASSLTPFVGQSVTLSATTAVPFGAVARYQWDLDGDGRYETDTGTTPVATLAAALPLGSRTIGLRATAGGGASTVVTLTVAVVNPPDVGVPAPPVPPGPGGPSAPPPPPNGPIGVSIDSGARYTNSARVMVRLVWPRGAKSALLSNDGGFGGAHSMALAPSVPWTLDSSGPERLPKTVYVRFEGAPPNYTDDVILDQTAPAIDSVSLTASQPAKASVAAAKRRRYVMRLKAHDKTSGVDMVQVATVKSRPARAVKYSSRVAISTRPRYVRVRDRAGNLSKWRNVR